MFERGVTTTTIEVTVVGDTVVEVDEHVLIGFENPTNIDLGPLQIGLGSGLIVDDDG